MELLTAALRHRPLANGAFPSDHVPVVRFVNPLGSASWLIRKCDANRDTLFGLADLGSVSLAELAAVRLPFGLRLARELHFAARHPLSVYAAEVRMHGQITATPAHLDEAAAALARAHGAGRSRSPP